jgi:ABC-type polar amino acid transport system ATPase subunit
MALSCSHINLSYSGRDVLRDVSVQVEPGRVTALIGPSGAGKSTALRSLAFLESPSSGSIALDGSVYHYPLAEEAPSPAPWPAVTAVFQQLFLWPHLTLRANITLPLTLGKLPDAAGRTEKLIDRFEMAGFVDRYPNQVSGGQRQRAALARALALEPSYLLLDEITSALDVEQAASIVSHLSDLKREGIGILIVTHHLGFLHRTADTIVFMENGSVIEAGGHEMLVSPRSPGMRRFLTAVHRLDDKSQVVADRIEAG